MLIKIGSAFLLMCFLLVGCIDEIPLLPNLPFGKPSVAIEKQLSFGRLYINFDFNDKKELIGVKAADFNEGVWGYVTITHTDTNGIRAIIYKNTIPLGKLGNYGRVSDDINLKFGDKVNIDISFVPDHALPPIKAEYILGEDNYIVVQE